MSISALARKIAREQNLAVFSLVIDRRTKTPSGGVIEVNGKIDDDLLSELTNVQHRIIERMNQEREAK